jgi:hypothetical protein
MAVSTIDSSGLTSPLSATNLGTPSAINLSNATALAVAAMPTGSVIQVVYTTTNTLATYTRGQTITPLTTSITPSSTSSRIIVIACIGIGQNTASDVGINCNRNGTALQTGSGGASTNPTWIAAMNVGSGDFYQQTLTLLDSPSTTSAISYTFDCYINSGNTMYFNRRGSDQSYCGSSMVILMEVR